MIGVEMCELICLSLKSQCRHNGYRYDDAGNRTVKLSGNGEAVFVCASDSSNGFTQTNRFTAYPNPYMVYNGSRYYKHIYVGAERIVSKVSVNNPDYDPRQEACAGNTISGYEVKLRSQQQALSDSIASIYAKFEVPYYPNNNDDYGYNWSDGRRRSVTNPDSYGELAYFYHSDHLGSTLYVTTGNGDRDDYQQVEYTPFGEIFIEERNNTWNTPYLFNAKELDEETGLYYYGARYYDPRTSLWLSTDLMELKYPNVSTYAYCANNPINAIDPNGEDWRISSNRDKDGTLNINMTVTGVIYNASSTTFDMDKLRSEIQNQIQDVYNFTGKGFKVSMTANIRTAKSIEDISSTDHVFAIVDQSALRKSTVLADAVPNGLRIRVGTKLAEQIQNGTNRRTIAHELGHTGGLYDTNLSHNKLVINNKNANLMTQIIGLDNGIDKNNAIQIEIPQLNSIIRSYNHGKLNQRSPISTEIDYQFKWCWPFIHKQTLKKLNLK